MNATVTAIMVAGIFACGNYIQWQWIKAAAKARHELQEQNEILKDENAKLGAAVLKLHETPRKRIDCT